MSGSDTNLSAAEQKAALHELLADSDVSAEQLELSLSKYAKLLVSSDITLYNMIIHYQYTHKIIPEYRPKSPPDGYPEGVIELGPFLYWITTSSPPSSWSRKYKLIWYVLQAAIIVLVDKSAIDESLYDDFKGYIGNTGIPAKDGTLYGYDKYQQLDKHWAEAAVHYLYYKTHHKKIAQFNCDAPIPITLSGASDSKVRIAVIGDWGTGRYDPGQPADKQDGTVDGPALDIMNAIACSSIDPDYIIHLGDVYYAGTDHDALIDPNEEKKNLVDVWSSTNTINFTLNSNHEMYGGAKGYFGVALENPLFSQQKKRSFFELHYGDWKLIGLDSAYHCDDDNFYMYGRVTDATQKNLLAKYQGDAKHVMLFSHHNAISFAGSACEQLWTDVTADDALGAAPAYWYWGHIHEGIAYSRAAIHGDTTAMRCVGHSAVPNGEAWELLGKDGKTIPQVSYFANTPVDPEGNSTARVFNGFALLTICKETSRILEEFFELDSNGAAIKRWESESPGN